MKKSVILLFAMALGLAAVSCENKEEPAVEAAFLEVSPESISGELDGGGDGILISIKSNLSWTVSAEDNGGGTVDWLVINPSSGKGDGSVFCFILRGGKDAGRSCRIKVCSVASVREETLQRLMLGNCVCIARKWLFACSPAPIMPMISGSLTARYFAATVETAAVRRLEHIVPSRSARGNPVSVSDRRIVALRFGSPFK